MGSNCCIKALSLDLPFHGSCRAQTTPAPSFQQPTTATSCLYLPKWNSFQCFRKAFPAGVSVGAGRKHQIVNPVLPNVCHLRAPIRSFISSRPSCGCRCFYIGENTKLDAGCGPWFVVSSSCLPFTLLLLWLLLLFLSFYLFE